ncbi:right-handed parallel beta-helix repeat-containing protein [Paenibacillus sp. P22]|uniref:right-handed parallel beta-helix repeat-containing protein n=1 Tax=Paenibacillus sp. P22 TaxID=483908 RepID=UPI00038FF82E|nr:right-handed parallel beta-helix repeat-containing protein [Paenibacillus sp. P22]CDN44188.1 Putative uncharacterized protein [Paenibacillus sp. P22]
MASKRTANMKMNDWAIKDGFQLQEWADNFKALDSEIAVRGLNANWKGAKGDGSENDTAALLALFATVKTGDRLVFPPRCYYKTNAPNFLYTFTGLKDIQIEGNGSTIEVADQGLSFTFIDGLSVKGLKIVRSSQSVWGANKTGLYVGASSQIDVSRNEISKFTDAISITDCKTARVYKNKLHHLGEEPIVCRISRHVIVEDNEAWTYLGDGILNKGTSDMTVSKNYLHDPVDKDLDAVTWATISGGNVAAPIQGGGITCNAESGPYPNDNMTINDNRIYGTIYGIILSAITVAKITKNRLKNIGNAAGIAVSDSAAYNPGKIPGLDIDISRNIIQGFAKGAPQPGIQLKTGAVVVNSATISFNRVYPNGAHKGIVASGDILVTGNTIKGAELGIELLDGAKGFQNTVLDPFQADFGRAISVYDGSSACHNTVKSTVPVIVWGKNAIVSENAIINTSTTNYAVVIQPGAEGNQIINNTISSAALKEIGVGDPDWRDKNTYYGWIDRGGVKSYIPPAAPRVSSRPSSIDTGRLPGATFFDLNIGKNVTWSGTKWIESNSGKAVFSGDGSSVTVTIPHGLSIRPTAYTVSPASNDAGFAEIRNVDADATNIIIRFKNALYAGSNNISICWFAESK